MRLILMIIACILLGAAALGATVRHVNLGWLGLFFWALAVTMPV